MVISYVTITWYLCCLYDRQKDATAFWLNEGWTTYFERVLQQVLHGPLARDFSYIIGAKALVDSLRAYESKPKYQRLVIEFEHGEVRP
jgi:leukotriene-A4 hydrolase